MQQTIAERLLYSTIKLVVFKQGAEIRAGTGFFYNFNFPDGLAGPVIITNKHVIEGADQIEIVCHQASPGSVDAPSGKFLWLRLNFNSAVNHPDPNVDLCALPIAPLMQKCTEAGTPILFVHINNSLIPKAEDWAYFDAIEDVTMIGCPNGLYDDANKMPLARRGITATSIGRDYNGRPQFLIDMACFPGSSGSPVFVYNTNGYLDRKTNNQMLGGTRIRLVGVLFAGPTITSTGEIILSKSVEIDSMMHLGYVLRATAILELENTMLGIYASGHASKGMN